LAWSTATHREVASDVSTPLFYRGRFFVLNSDRKVLSCVDPATGQPLWSGTLESPVKFEASPTGADGRIFMVNHRADVFVADAGDAFKLLHTAAFGEGEERNVRASIAVAGGCLFIRTASKLYCVGKS
jgi:outer membrane protein assembly factor BamB